MRGQSAEAQVQGREHPAVGKLGGRSIRVTVAPAPGRRKQQGKLEPQGSEQEGPGAPDAGIAVRWQATGTQCPVLFQLECVLRATES